MSHSTLTKKTSIVRYYDSINTHSHQTTISRNHVVLTNKTNIERFILNITNNIIIICNKCYINNRTEYNSSIMRNVDLCTAMRT